MQCHVFVLPSSLLPLQILRHDMSWLEAEDNSPGALTARRSEDAACRTSPRRCLSGHRTHDVPWCARVAAGVFRGFFCFGNGFVKSILANVNSRRHYVCDPEIRFDFERFICLFDGFGIVSGQESKNESSQESRENSGRRSIGGTWQTVVTPRNCATGRSGRTGFSGNPDISRRRNFNGSFDRRQFGLWSLGARTRTAQLFVRLHLAPMQFDGRFYRNAESSANR